MVQWAQGTRWHSSMTGEGTISFYSLEIKQTGDGGSAQGLTSYWGQYDDEANQAALGCGDPTLGFTINYLKQLRIFRFKFIYLYFIEEVVYNCILV